MVDFKKPILNKNGKPLKILQAAAHFCIRVVKRGVALKSLGYEVHGMGNKLPYGYGIYDTYGAWSDEKQFKREIKHYIDSGIDILDYSNEPDYPVQWVREVINDMGKQDEVKLVVDLHDLDSIRRGFIPKPEREMFNCADGLIYVSQSIEEMTNKLHYYNKPTITLLSYCNKGTAKYDEDKIPERKGLVYEGGANPPEDTDLNAMFSYRSLYQIIKKLVEMENEVHMYCGNISAFESYQPTGAVLYPPTMYDKMMEELVKYKYGILVFNNADGQKDQVNYTHSNKQQEYLQAGMPSLACWCPEMMKWVEHHKIGFTFNHIDEIGNCSQLENKYPEVMENIKQKRKDLVMESFLWRLENLYAELLGLPKKKIPKRIKELSIFEYGEENTHRLLN